MNFSKLSDSLNFSIFNEISCWVQHYRESRFTKMIYKITFREDTRGVYWKKHNSHQIISHSDSKVTQIKKKNPTTKKTYSGNKAKHKSQQKGTCITGQGIVLRFWQNQVRVCLASAMAARGKMELHPNFLEIVDCHPKWMTANWNNGTLSHCPLP